MSVNAKALVRWWLKKIGRKGVSSLGAIGAKRRPSQVRALMYHRFGHIEKDPFCIQPEVFEAQVAYIKNNGLAMAVDELDAYLKGEAEPSQSRVMITIDDGYESTHSIALPILKKYGVPAISYITPSLIGQSAAETNSPEDFCSWSQVAELIAGNVTVGCHAWTHQPMTEHDAEMLEKQTRHAKTVIENQLGTPISSFAYPYGTRADFNEVTEQAIQDAGYRTAFTAQHGAIMQDTNPLELPRIKVESGDPMWLFEQLLHGSMDSWRHIDSLLWRLQNRVPS